MKTKWNGWGEKNITYRLKNSAIFSDFLKNNFGELKFRPSIPFDPESLRSSRLDVESTEKIKSIVGTDNLSLDALDRTVHSYGKSYYDLIRLRSGLIKNPTDGVAYPETEEEVIELLQYATEKGIAVIPFGGGSTVVSGVEPDPSSPITLTIDLSRLNQLIDLDESSKLATFQAGISGPELERFLNERGFSLAHFPQSFEYSTLGGWIATRSAGHKSTAFGKIEAMVAALKIALPDGTIVETPNFPAAAMGPDLVQLFCGSEGRFGIFLQATVNIQPLPQTEVFRNFMLKSFEDGIEIVRLMLQENIKPSLLRLSDESETRTLFSIDALSSSKSKHQLYKKGLSILDKLGYQKSLLILGFEGAKTAVQSSVKQSAQILNLFNHKSVGSTPARSWQNSRYDHPYLRDELLDRGILVDTLETATTWSNLLHLYHQVREAIESTFEKQGVPGKVGVHLSHAYRNGASLYFTFMAPQIEGKEIEQWLEVKRAATNAIVEANGALSHHHSVGRDHAAWLENSIGKSSYKLLNRIGQTISNGANMNPNILFKTSVTADPNNGSFSAATRRKNLERFRNEKFDLVVIGGGITGAGIARDAALRGMKVALLDKNDFAFGTSSRSSKLIHGGLRYLKYLHIKLVRESLREREVLLNIAPHLVHPAQFLLPVFKGRDYKKFEINIGLIGYDLMAGSKKLEPHKMLSKEELIKRVPFINQHKLNGGFIYPDCVVDDARLTLMTIKSAAEAGAAVANYTEVIDFEIKDSSISRAKFFDNIDQTSGFIAGKAFVNATGPWTDSIRKYEGENTPLLRPTKGIHIVLHREKMPVNEVVVITTLDERMIFVVPHGEFTYIGTTDTDFDGDYDDVYADENDVEYLIEATNQEFQGVKITREDVISSWAGLRPLIYEEGSTTEISRDYDIFISDNNLVTITGGKLTTYRHMAEVLINRVLKHFNDSFDSDFEVCRTKELPLFGGDFSDFSSFHRTVKKSMGRQININPQILERLLMKYGTNYLKIFSYGLEDSSLLQPLTPGCNVLRAEVCYAIEEEMVIRLTDFMVNRSHLLTFDQHNGREAAYVVAEIMRRSLNWTEENYTKQINEYFELVERVAMF